MSSALSRQFGRDFSSHRHSAQKTVLSADGRRARLWILAGGALLWLALVVHRLFSLQISDFERWQDWALKQHFSEVTVASERGPVYDRNGKLMAVSVPAGSVYVRPHQIKDKAAASTAIAKELKLERAAVMKKLNDKKPFVWIVRQIPRAQAEKVNALAIKGVGFIIESRRVYPYNQAASTLIGKVGIDGNGLSGIEAAYERRLHGEHVTTRVTRDAFGNTIQVADGVGDGFDVPRGKPLTLTLDADLQLIVDEELEAGRQAANARSAMAVMVDSDTGEIVAMSQAPSMNFNSDSVRSKQDMRNLAIETVFEPGSIMKPIVAAAAIEAKVVRPEDMINCEHGRYQYASHTIKDVHPVDTVSFRDVVIRSSNIGMTKVGMKLGREKLYSALKGFGFGEGPKLGLPGETGGILRPVETWAQVDLATHSFGQGVAVTPLQMVRAMSAIANGGRLPALHMIDDGGEVAHKRIISEKTAEKVRDMLYGVVEDEHGTGTKALIKGVRIGGKTGTAQIARESGGGYQPGAYIASFVGFADATELGIHKTLSLIVAIREPNSNTIYGGTLAAPVFQRIMQRSLNFIATKKELHSPAPEVSFKPVPGMLPAARSQPGTTSSGVRPVAYRG